ncbi:hypothetical protein J1614_012232 [Plenodomus biglobosus]|nr:hypothetical protein J1614_012232 [Plenodomus biglobosus]
MQIAEVNIADLIKKYGLQEQKTSRLELWKQRKDIAREVHRVMNDWLVKKISCGKLEDRAQKEFALHAGFYPDENECVYEPGQALEDLCKAVSGRVMVFDMIMAM